LKLRAVERLGRDFIIFKAAIAGQKAKLILIPA
jgi:hypothetical protein